MWLLLPFHFFNAVLILTLVALLCCCEEQERAEIAQTVQGMFGTRTPETQIERVKESDMDKMD